MAVSQRREYTGGAGNTALNGGINSTDTSINIQDATNWPTGGVNGPFTATIDFGLSNEETVLVESRTGTTLTIAAGGRGNDDTAASSHANNAPIHHSATADDFDDANRHIWDDTSDDHSQYMRTDGTRHDVTARHQAGTTIPTAVPGTVTPEDTAAEGVSTSLARADHTHGTTSGAPAAVGLGLSEGVSDSIPRLDHVHTIGTDAINSISMFSINVEPIVKQASAPSTETNRLWLDTSSGEQDLRRWNGSAWVTLRRVVRYTASQVVDHNSFTAVGSWTAQDSFNPGFSSTSGNTVTLDAGAYWVSVNFVTNSGVANSGAVATIELSGTSGWATRRIWVPAPILFATGGTLTQFRATTGTDLTVTAFQNGGQSETFTVEMTIERI